MRRLNRAENRKMVMRQNEFVTGGGAVVEYLTFPGLQEQSCITHLFTTRLGGVSEGCFSSMNLSFARGDAPEAVLENYRRVAEVMGTDIRHIVCSDQTHTVNIRCVDERDAGKGVTIPKDYTEVDGLITNTEGLCLATFYADCVPLYFVDPVKRVIGLAHSGWRGTLAGMGKGMLETMQSRFGCAPTDILAAIGPSICRDCYEISEEVAKPFTEGFWREKQVVSEGKKAGKYQLDLWKANAELLKAGGVPPQNIEVTDICTCCNPEYLYSHRASHGRRGNMGAFLMLNRSC